MPIYQGFSLVLVISPRWWQQGDHMKPEGYLPLCGALAVAWAWYYPAVLPPYAWILFLSLWICLFWTFHSGSVTLCGLSLCIMLSQPVHFVAAVRTLTSRGRQIPLSLCSTLVCLLPGGLSIRSSGLL